MLSLERKKAGLIISLRAQGVTCDRVLAAMEATPREEFLPPAMRDRAYEDSALPIGLGQTISQPLVVAHMCQALQLTPDTQSVLEIGTGCGYHAAVLAKLVKRVYTMERHKNLLKPALERFEALRLRNVAAMAADGFKGWPLKREPFDRISLTAAPEERPPQPLFDQLAIGGIMVAPVGNLQTGQILRRYVKQENGLITQEDIMDVRFVPLLPDVTDEEFNPNQIDESHAIGRVRTS